MRSKKKMDELLTDLTEVQTDVDQEMQALLVERDRLDTQLTQVNNRLNILKERQNNIATLRDTLSKVKGEISDENS